MIKFGKWIAKHKKLIVALSLILLIPSVIGISKTRINYDILSYLPNSLETVKGQDIMVDQFGAGAYSMIIVEDMKLQDVQKLKQKLEKTEHVDKIIWYDDIADLSVPKEMLPQKIRNVFFHKNATLMIAMFDKTTSSDETMDAVTHMRHIVGKQCFLSGMSGVVTDIKNLVIQEIPIYVTIAAILSFLVLCLSMDSFMVAILFLLSIGMAILYNLGTNIFLNDVSYLTMALTAILQLGVTMDYSIFLLHSYEDNLVRFENDKNRAMAHAISNTFKSVAGSSVTTIAGFIALCFMTFALGANLGIVMAKGVVIGVVCCITILPALILVFDSLIERTKHRCLMPDFTSASHFITKHYKAFIVIFLVMLFPAVYGNNHTGIYYNIDKSLPQDLPSNVANKKLSDEFHMSNIHMILLKNGLSSKEKTNMQKEIDKVDGVEWCLGMNSIIGSSIPSDMIPDSMKETLQSDDYEMQFICSKYKSATKEVNQQIKQINSIVKKYSSQSMVIGEAPLMNDLETVTDVDLRNVNMASIAAIFVIILIVFRSISLPFLLVAVIEFAINVNMAIPYYTGLTLPFVASIVIGTIQLGATVDYAILMTSRYQKERLRGVGKKDSIRIAHETSMQSIITSGSSFFAATVGIAFYSNIDMISSICTLLARGAIISTIAVICILPAMFMVFDKVICKTTLHMGHLE
ncbi:efflux RND transporter permease subunit [Anaerostipes sp.]|uniref:efflux RND transporter permease subunit n=1 Tax=Anaerostipes sp. TaxID=1872530 RepID=UPI002590D30C|nr:MMPL family transporter [Anaerostipes sp.]MCI5623904.1 MMPL family transporter [Anaerostipes sp.]